MDRQLCQLRRGARHHPACCSFGMRIRRFQAHSDRSIQKKRCNRCRDFRFGDVLIRYFLQLPQLFAVFAEDENELIRSAERTVGCVMKEVVVLCACKAIGY